MATTFKRLGAGTITTANTQTTVYTVPTGSKTIIKSFIISNSSASNVTIIVRMSMLEIIYNYIIQPNDTIVIPVMDQCLDAIDGTITIYASAANSISYYISGIETLTTDPEYSDVSRLGYGALPTYPTFNFLFGSVIKDRLVKGIILCNTKSADTRVYMNVTTGSGGFNILSGFLIKSYDTIVVPTTDLLIPGSSTISGSGAGVNYFITGKEL